MNNSKRKLNFTAADYNELRKAYRFIPDNSNNDDDDDDDDNQIDKKRKDTTWQERMALNDEKELYREFVLADLSRVHLKGNPIGLRWRTKVEVLNGKGDTSCGNKHCPSYNYVRKHSKSSSSSSSNQSTNTADAISTHTHSAISNTCDGKDKTVTTSKARIITEKEEEIQRLQQTIYGKDLHSYEVPFSYREQGDVTKSELVKLRLCARCAPLLFYNKGGVLGAKDARNRYDTSPHDETNAHSTGVNQRKSEESYRAYIKRGSKDD